jgi:hypothetical protein
MDKSDFQTSRSQLRLLLWKNFILQKRSWIGTCLELFLPAFFAIILLPIRSIVESNNIANDTVYSPFRIDSLPSGLIPQTNYFYTAYSETKWCLGYAPSNQSLIDELMAQTGKELGLRLFRNTSIFSSLTGNKEIFLENSLFIFFSSLPIHR